MKLPIGKATMDVRIDHAIRWAKRKMRLEYADEDDDEDIDEDSDSNDDYE